MSTLIAISNDRLTSRAIILRQFKEDSVAGRFVGREGQWAAYVDGKLAKIGPDDQVLFDDVRSQHPGSDIALQPIGKLAPIKSKRPRAGSVRAKRR